MFGKAGLAGFHMDPKVMIALTITVDAFECGAAGDHYLVFDKWSESDLSKASEVINYAHRPSFGVIKT